MKREHWVVEVQGFVVATQLTKTSKTNIHTCTAPIQTKTYNVTAVEGQSYAKLNVCFITMMVIDFIRCNVAFQKRDIFWLRGSRYGTPKLAGQMTPILK